MTRTRSNTANFHRLVNELATVRPVVFWVPSYPADAQHSRERMTATATLR
jgi:hypothetical protein